MSTTDDARDEERVVALRRVLQSEEPLPLGMRSRWEAGMSTERRRQAQPSGAFLSVAGVCAFVGGNALHGLGSASTAVVLTLVFVAAVYAAGMRILASREWGHAPKRVA